MAKVQQLVSMAKVQQVFQWPRSSGNAREARVCRPPRARTGPGTRSRHGTGRRPTPAPAEISESPVMGRALTKRVDYHGAK
jgi:hypothetical protein